VEATEGVADKHYLHSEIFQLAKGCRTISCWISDLKKKNWYADAIWGDKYQTLDIAKITHHTTSVQHLLVCTCDVEEWVHTSLTRFICHELPAHFFEVLITSQW